MNLKWFVSILVATMVFGAIAGAEDIKNDSGCDVCDGAIHFGPEETRDIFGDEVRQKISGMWWKGQKSVWIDLDGVWKNTEMPKNENQFEIKIYGTVLRIFVKSLVDDSIIEIVINNVEPVADNASPLEAPVDWLPEIYLYAGHADPINLTDPVDAAWKKMEERHIYQWISRGKDLRTDPKEMRTQIMSVLNTLAP